MYRLKHSSISNHLEDSTQGNHRFMDFPNIREILAAFLLIAGILLSTGAQAADAKTYRFINNTGQNASDLHATFRWTGGSLITVVVANPPGCPAPAIPSNGNITNTMVIDWGVACIPQGGSVIVTVATNNGPIAFVSGFWTSPKRQNEPGIGRIDPEKDVEELERNAPEDECDPGSGLYILILIMIVLLVLLFFCYFRKRGQPTDGDPKPGKPTPFDDTILELISKRDLLIKIKANKSDAQKANIDQAVKKINEAIDGLKKMRDQDPTAPSEGEIERALRDAAKSVDQANPGGSNPTLRRLRDCLIDIARNLF